MVFGGFEFQRADQSKPKKRKAQSFPSFQSAKKQVSSKMFETASSLVQPRKKHKTTEDDEIIIVDVKKFTQGFPSEVWENIACTLPIMDMRSLSLTCKMIHGVVERSDYMKYKKLYYRFLRGDIHPENNKIVREIVENKSDDVIWIKYCVSLLPQFKVKSDFVKAIQDMKEYHSISNFLETDNTLHILTYIIVFSDGMSAILSILRRLSLTTIHLPVLLNYFYCLAFHSLVLLRHCHVDNNIHLIHYNIYYAVYMFENEFQATMQDLNIAYERSGQQSITKYASNDSKLRLTHEQLQICSFDPKKGLTAKIIAFAGTGKTTTLLRYTQLRPSLKFLLIVFNK